MNAAEQARFHVQTLLAHGVAIAAAREQLGVTGASEIWGGVLPREKPGWYVWLRQCPGAFALDLEHAMAADTEQEPRVRAQLSVRYYPARTAPAFFALSCEERAIVTGGCLDETGAPDVHRASEIPPGLFLVGALEVAFDDTQVTRAIALGAPERSGDLPTWDLALPLFSALVGFAAQSERRSAVRLVEARDTSYRSAAVIFEPGDTFADYVDPDAAIVRDEILSPHCARRDHTLNDKGIRVHPSWFAERTAHPQQLGCCR